MIQLSPTEQAFRVGLFAGLLGILAWLPASLHLLISIVLMIGSGIFFFEIWVARRSRAAQLHNLVWALVLLGGAGALLAGWGAVVATPLIAMSAACIALWFVGTLGEGGDDSDGERLN